MCSDCHVDGFADFLPSICLTCHQDVGISFISGHTQLFGLDCLVCHDGVDSYGKNFDHNAFQFALAGKHGDVLCAECHPSARSLADLQLTSMLCVSCHLEDDAHNGELGQNCDVCHDPAGWKEAVFDHSSTGFLLEGGHADLDCENCHATATYQGVDPLCVSCHLEDEPHNGQFGSDCATCHVVISWQEVIFSHQGEYAADCTACHSADKPANHYAGQCSACHLTSAWRPATFDHQASGAVDCLSCHTADKPANHFGGQCSICHSTSAWEPASFDHTFPLNHGDANQQCDLCHTNNTYPAYTCYGCHEHSPADIRNEHEGVSNLNDCVRCHWDGQEHEDDNGGDDD